jgi:hypothetical protein
MCVIDIVKLISFTFWTKKTGNRDLLIGTFPLFFKPAPAVLAYKNREQLPVYTGLQKPRTITRFRVQWLTKTENNYPFTLAYQN